MVLGSFFWLVFKGHSWPCSGYLRLHIRKVPHNPFIFPSQPNMIPENHDSSLQLSHRKGTHEGRAELSLRGSCGQDSQGLGSLGTSELRANAATSLHLSQMVLWKAQPAHLLFQSAHAGRAALRHAAAEGGSAGFPETSL